jgi:hypothetical protein
MNRLSEVRKTAGDIDDRKQQLTRSEERLARADALLVDINAGLATLQGQKVIVDKAVEQAGSLRVLLKQAEGVVEALREERNLLVDVRTAVLEVQDSDNSAEQARSSDETDLNDHEDSAEAA